MMKVNMTDVEKSQCIESHQKGEKDLTINKRE
jgi:hypothetical protein